MPERPSDCGIYMENLEETLLSCFEQWKEVAAVLNRHSGKSESAQVRDFDLIDCFCSDVKNRLTEIRKQSEHRELWRFGFMGEPPS
jgi:hypothetical protein